MTEVSNSKDKVNVFFDNLKKLSKNNLVNLKKCAGKEYKEAKANSLSVFYSILPNDVYTRDEYIYYTVACLYAMYDGSMGNKTFQENLKMLKNTGIEKKFIYLLDDTLNEDSLMLSKIFRLVKMLQREGHKINFENLLRDLLYWNHPDKFIQRKWAFTYFSNEKLDNKEEEK